MQIAVYECKEQLTNTKPGQDKLPYNILMSIHCDSSDKTYGILQL